MNEWMPAERNADTIGEEVDRCSHLFERGELEPNQLVSLWVLFLPFTVKARAGTGPRAPVGGFGDKKGRDTVSLLEFSQ